MSRVKVTIYDGLIHHFTPSGRRRLRRLRRAETDALVAANRLQIVRLLAGIGEYQLGLAELTRRHTVSMQPRLDRWAQSVLESLANAIQDEIAGFVLRGWEEHR